MAPAFWLNANKLMDVFANEKYLRVSMWMVLTLWTFQKFRVIKTSRLRSDTPILPMKDCTKALRTYQL